MAEKEKPAKRLHKATYSTDKKKGGYLIRVVGPNANMFAGREVPVVTRDNQEHVEKLVRLIWTGIDVGTEEMKGTGLPVCLYTFESKPKSKSDEIMF
jgi:hypothetical protein